MRSAVQSLKSAYRYAGRPGIARALRWTGLSVDRPELRERSTRWLEFGRTGSYRPPPPVGPEPVPEELQRKNRLLSDPQPFVCELSDIQLVGRPGLPVTRDGRFILECAEGSSRLLSDTIARVVSSRHVPTHRGRRGHIHERAATSLLGLWSDGFFHWFADYLPRVRGIEAYAERTGVYPDVLVGSEGPSWQRDSLELLGVPNGRVVETDGMRRTVDRFIVPSLPRQTEADSPRWGYTQSPRGLRWVGDRIRQNLGIDPGNENRILITRRGAQKRRLANDKEVIEALSPYGFEPVTLSNLSLESQVELFAKADAVVAPHGAGLVNSIYAEDLKILELFGEYVNACYYCLAGGLDLTYRYELCEDRGSDIYVDVAALERAVKTIVD